MIQIPLPSPILKEEWRPADPLSPDNLALTQALQHAIRSPGWNPKTTKLSDGYTAIDYCTYPDSDELHSYLVVKVEDHPILRSLPANAPKVIRHMYRADVRLRYARADECWSYFADDRRAEEAARRYNAVMEAANGR